MRALLDALPADPGQWLGALDKLGTVGLLGLFATALLRGWIVTGAQYGAKVKECDALRAASDALLKGYQDREAAERLWHQGRRVAGPQEEGATR